MSTLPVHQLPSPAWACYIIQLLKWLHLLRAGLRRAYVIFSLDHGLITSFLESLQLHNHHPKKDPFPSFVLNTLFYRNLTSVLESVDSEVYGRLDFLQNEHTS